MKTVHIKTLSRWGVGIVGDAQPQHVYALMEDHAIISKVEVFPRVVCSVGQEYTFLGLGGVWTSSNRRKKGCATALCEIAEQFAREKFSGALLFSLENTLDFYEGRDYVRRTGVTTIQQPKGEAVPVPPQVHVLTKEFDCFIDPSEGLEIRGLPW